MSAIYIAGFGCRRGCSAASLRDLLDSALREYVIDRSLLSGIASIDSKRDEAGLLELATILKLPLSFLSSTQLQAYEHRLTKRSAIVLETTGAAGVAEAAALAQAELLAMTELLVMNRTTLQRAELIIEKHSNGEATVALARIDTNATLSRASQ